MAVKDYMEGSKIALAVTLKSGTGKDAQATFTFKVVDPADKELALPPGFDKTKKVKVDLEKRTISFLKSKASATVNIDAPKVEKFSKDIPHYTISYKYKVDGDAEDTDGATEYRIWPRKIKVTAYKKGTKTANPKMKLRVAGAKDSDGTTDDKGIVTLTAREKRLTEIEELEGYRIVKWIENKDKGVEREVEIEKDYKVAFLDPKKPVSGNLIRHVNLEAKGGSPKSFGQLVEFTVIGAGDDARSAGEKHATEGDEVFVECTFSKESKRDDPVPELKPAGVEGLKKASKDTVYTGKVKVAKDLTAKFKVELGNAGGETCTVKIGRTKACGDDSMTLENWRRLYYQVSRPASLATPDLTVFLDNMKSVFIECVALPEVTLASGTAPGNATPVWMDGLHIGETAGTRYLLAGNTKANAGKFEALLKTGVSPTGSTEVPPADLVAHFLFAHDQVDFKDVPAVELDDCLSDPTLAAVFTETKDFDLDGTGVLVPTELPTQFVMRPRRAGANFFAKSSTGGAVLKSLKWKIGTQGAAFTSAKVTYTKADGPTVDVNTTANAAFRDAYAKRGAAVLDISFSFEQGDDYLGEAFGDKGRHLLISTTYGTRAAAEQCKTMAHELGHTLKMAVSPGYDVSGMSDPQKKHGRHYSLSGNHCADGLSDADYKKYAKIQGFDWERHVEVAKDGSETVTDLTAECTCIMYGIGHTGCTVYCDRCRPYFIAHDVKKFG